jgi:hypothetical protein
MATMRLFKVDAERTGRVWFMRIASLAAMFGVVAAIGVFFHKGNALVAGLLVGTIPILAALFSWSWTGSLCTSLERAKRYIQGAEGDHRHEWYSFKGQRVRVFLDEMQQPWFALNEIVFILEIEDQKHAFRHYTPDEHGTPASASEPCLSESGLRRLIKYSKHPDAGALGLWLEREVLRMLKNSKARQAEEDSR